MNPEPFTARLLGGLRRSILAIGFTAAAVAAGNLFGRVSDAATWGVTIAAAIPTAVLFLTATFDPGVRRAFLAHSYFLPETRARLQARQRATPRDRLYLLLALALVLLSVAASGQGRQPAAALAFVGALLVGVAENVRWITAPVP